MKKIIIFGLIFLAVLVIGLSIKTNQVSVNSPQSQLANAPVAVTPIIPPPAQINPPSIKLVPGNQIIQGETLRVVFKNPGNASSSFVFQNKKYDFFDYNGEWNALIPFAYNTATGTVKFNIGSSTESVSVEPGNFNIVKIALPQLISTPAQVAKYQAERKKVLATYASSSPKIYFSKSFGFPLESMEITNPFGETYLDTTTGSKTFHNGVDLRADVDTPVMAINDGIVKTSDEYTLEGKFVIIDHGFNIFSNYLHLSKIIVSAGDKVLKGQTIGLSGATGESVGPHLHFMVKINNIPVDPLAFIKIWK